jgi:transmembrane sensor
MTAPYDTDEKNKQAPSPMHRPSDTSERSPPPGRVDAGAAGDACPVTTVASDKGAARLRAEAAVWMIRLDAGRIHADDAALVRWCARSSAHRDALASARLNWARATPNASNAQTAMPSRTALRSSDRAERPNEPRQSGNRRRGMSSGAPHASAPPGHRATTRRSPFAVRLGASIVVAGAALSIAALFWHAPDFDSGTGSVRTWTLADGTVMRLDAQTAVDLRYSADTRRIVLRHGRAAFTVAHGDPRPFVVDTHDASVTDIGTAFQVDSRDTSTQPLTVLVTQGAIRFANAGVAQTMHAGDIGHAVHGSAPTVIHGNIDALSADTAWQRGRLQFDNRPLASVVAELNRYFPGHRIFVDEAVQDQRVSGNFALNDPASALATLVEVLHLKQTTWAGRLIFLDARSGT